MTTETELRMGCGEKESLGDNGCAEGHLCESCEAKLTTLTERNREIEMAFDELISYCEDIHSKVGRSILDDFVIKLKEQKSKFGLGK